jgi:hypothetical protein
MSMLIGHGPHWINRTIFTFINENNGYFRCPYRIWSKFLSFDMKKNGNLRWVIGFMKKNVNLGVLRMIPYVPNGVPQLYLDPKDFRIPNI